MIELYDIITLKNNLKYTVAQQVFYNDKEYLLLVQVDEDENLLDDKVIVEKVKTKTGYGIKEITDKKIYDEVKSRMIDLLLNS